MQSDANPSTIQRNIMPPSSGSKSMLGKQVTSRVNVYSTNFLALKMDAVHASTTLVNFYKTTRYHIPEVSVRTPHTTAQYHPPIYTNIFQAASSFRDFPLNFCIHI
jgi:hypothetical protein